jgi:arsenate reductase (thioredoxin)
MAAAFFNAMSHPDCARAISAGTAPAERVFDEVVVAMHERKLDLSAVRPQKFSPELVERVEWIITLGCGAVVATDRRVDDWSIDDPAAAGPDEVRRIRDAIEQRVWKLIVREGWVRLRPRALASGPRRIR